MIYKKINRTTYKIPFSIANGARPVKEREIDLTPFVF